MRQSKFVKIKLEWVLEYGEEVNTLPGVKPPINDIVVDACKTLGIHPGTIILPGAKMSFSLYFPNQNRAKR